jgi:large subunit ribosomal protein L28
MSRTCDICGKKPAFGNNVSHANNATKRRWNVNVQNIRIINNNSPKKAKVCTRCIRTGKITKAI